MTSTLQLLAFDLGNSRTHLGRFGGRELLDRLAFETSAIGPVVEAAAAAWQSMDDSAPRAVLLAAVNDPAAERLTGALRDQLGGDIYRVGSDLPVPVTCQLDPETLTGVDRLLNAVAAWETLQQACVVVDAGTAVTVDFVDGAGTFCGGAIAPGARMQLDAMGTHTTALPELELAAPTDDSPYGANTAEAMRHGVFHGIRGMVQRLTERYAEAYGACPLVVATGGDAELLFEDEPLVDRIIPELTLMGMAIAADRSLAGAEDA